MQITIFPGGSGDTTYNYVETFFDAVSALLLAVLWRRPLPAFSHVWLWTIIRYFLAANMAIYGWAKLVTLQFDYPGPAHLLRFFVDASPMGLLWTMVGASTPYQMLTGFLEPSCAVLLFFRRTASNRFNPSSKSMAPGRPNPAQSGYSNNDTSCKWLLQLPRLASATEAIPITRLLSH